MLKHGLAIVCLTLSLSANAAILSTDSSFGTDTITRDTDTGLDWLDVTVTRALSYNDVTAQFGASGTYSGYRYATMAELDQLITNFGYTPLNTDCPYTSRHCDNPANGTDSELIEQMIAMLGDTYDAGIDEFALSIDVSPMGAGYTYGLLDTMHKESGKHDLALIFDGELVYRASGQGFHDYVDTIHTAYSDLDPAARSQYAGSFLVKTSEVPVPAAVWLFISALVGLVGKKRLSRR